MVQDPIANPPQILVEKTSQRVQEANEKSAVREAITYVCEAAIGERGSKLLALLEKIEEENGAAAAFDRILKLAEFSVPKAQRISVDPSNPGDRQPAMPTFVLNFNGPSPSVKVIDGDANSEV